MAATYYAQILREWDWSLLVEEAQANAAEQTKEDQEWQALVMDLDDGESLGSVYLGSVLNLAPSGKYYMPWCTNFTPDDARRDEAYYAALDKAAEKRGGFTFRGEGDPLDVFFGMIVRA